MDLSIIIINHNTKNLTNQTVESIFATKPEIDFEIIVVDNSTKEAERYQCERERVKVLSNVPNKGFAHGCNTGFQIATGEYVLFLNSDTIMQKDTLDKSVRYMKKHKEVGGLSVQVVLQDGSLDHGCKRGFPTPWNSFCYFSHLDRLFPKAALFNGYKLGHLDRNKTYQIDAGTGAYLMMPGKLYKHLNGFDETFFMYGEDIDLCWRIKAAGYQVIYYADVKCLHLKGQSGKSAKNEFVQYHFYNAMLIFYDRYYTDKYPRWLTGMIKFIIKRKMPQIDAKQYGG